MGVAILCSGQGRQHSGMFTLAAETPAAAGLFEHAANLLGGRDPREIVKRDSEEALHHDREGQILCTLQSLTIAAALDGSTPAPRIVAGYSVGELAAWGVAGRFSLRDTLDLAAFRAEAMDAVSQSGDGLLFVRGLSYDAIDQLCRKHDAAIAIINPGDAYIVGGSGHSLLAVAQDAGARNATRIAALPVEIASHTPRLSGASAVFRDRLAQVACLSEFSRTPRLLSGVDGDPVLDLHKGLDKLAAQISQTIHWAACLQACVESGAAAFLELGPGSALSSMAAAAYPSMPARSVEDFRTWDGVRAWIARHSG